MAEVSLTRARTGAVPPAPVRSPHPKAVLRTAGGIELVLPYAPRGTSLGGWGKKFSQQERPGRSPLVLEDGDSLPTLSFEARLAYSDHQAPVEQTLATLRRIAEQGDRITLVNLSPQEAGPWRLESIAVTGELRQHGTNHITRATVALSFVAASDANVKLGPVKGGKKGSAKGKLPTKHTVKAGETLAKLAERYYGEPGKWQLIAKRNDVKRPNELKPGTVLIIPDDDPDKGNGKGKGK